MSYVPTFAVHYFWGPAEMEGVKSEHHVSLLSELAEIGISDNLRRRAVFLSPGETMDVYPVRVKFPTAPIATYGMRLVIHRIE